ncbi:protein GAMETE EXPRESSED 2 isoform X2 [Punica granatum]|uniref:Protein GAMETE EXPRESSED 2 isoform X2 n=1 Tax=Punica granatum TaxID=22663 RepID=A0A6P8DPF1_PUNGR|nr:protein GAMETE EXPRESSED 2 isoform X2 [Punica granatum]
MIFLIRIFKLHNWNMIELNFHAIKNGSKFRIRLNFLTLPRYDLILQLDLKSARVTLGVNLSILITAKTSNGHHVSRAKTIPSPPSAPSTNRTLEEESSKQEHNFSPQFLILLCVCRTRKMAIHLLQQLLLASLASSTLINPCVSQLSENEETLPAFAFSWPNNNGTFRAGDVAVIDIKVLGNLENMSDFKPVISVNEKPGNSCYVSGVGLEHFGEGPSFSSWRIVFTPIRVGMFNVIITEDRFKVLDSSLHFEVLPGRIYSSVCSVSWIGLVNEFAAGTKATVRILPKDAFGNNVSSTTEPLDSYNFTVSALLENGSAASLANTTYMGQNEFGYIIIEFVASAAGKFFLQVLGQGANLDGSPLPFQVNPGPLDVPSCTAEWKFETNSWQIFSKVEIYIRQLDRYGNLIPGLYEFDADVIEKEMNLSIPIPDLYFEEVSPGIQLFSFSAVESGNFSLTIFDEEHNKSISNMPYEFTVFVGRSHFPEHYPLCVCFAEVSGFTGSGFNLIGYCDGSNSVVNGSGLNSSAPGKVAEFSIYLIDLFQYPSPVEIERVRVQIIREIDSSYVESSIYPLQFTNGSTQNRALTVSSANETTLGPAPSPNLRNSSTGAWSAWASAFIVVYLPEKSGTYQISVFCGNILLNSGSPFRKEVIAGEVDMTLSGVVELHPKVPKHIKNEVVVRLMDSFYNPVLGQQSRLKLEITSKNNSDFLNWAFVNNSDGSYSGHYVAMDVGTYELCVSFDGNPFKSCPSIVNAYSSEYFPQAYNDTASVWEDESIAFDALENDFFAGDNASILNFSQPSHGSLLQYERLLRYTPFRDFYGNDSFLYTIADVNGNQATGSVKINVLIIPPQFISFPTLLEATEDIISPKFGGYSGLRVTYSDLKENISVALSAQSGSVSLSPMMMELGQSELSIEIGDGEKDDLVLQGRVEVVNAALQSFQYLGNENFSGGDTIRVSSWNKNGKNDLDIPMFVEPINDPPFICAPGFIILNYRSDDKSLIFDRERDEFDFFVGDPDVPHFPGGDPQFLVAFSLEVSNGFIVTTLPAQLVNTTELKLKRIYQWQPLQTYVSISKHFMVQAVGVRFQGAINECNEVMQQLYYHGGDGGAVLTLKLNDLGNYGRFPECTEKLSQPLYAEASVNLIRRSPMSSLLAHSLGTAIIIELVVLLLLGVLLLFFTCKCAFLLVNERRKRRANATSGSSSIHNSRKYPSTTNSPENATYFSARCLSRSLLGGKLQEIRQRLLNGQVSKTFRK